jgi:hypothetical protein
MERACSPDHGATPRPPPDDGLGSVRLDHSDRAVLAVDLRGDPAIRHP